jgi:hypothetical protein
MLEELWDTIKIIQKAHMKFVRGELSELNSSLLSIDNAGNLSNKSCVNIWCLISCSFSREVLLLVTTHEHFFNTVLWCVSLSNKINIEKVSSLYWLSIRNTLKNPWNDITNETKPNETKHTFIVFVITGCRGTCSQRIVVITTRTFRRFSIFCGKVATRFCCCLHGEIFHEFGQMYFSLFSLFFFAQINENRFFDFINRLIRYLIWF